MQHPVGYKALLLIHKIIFILMNFSNMNFRKSLVQFRGEKKKSVKICVELLLRQQILLFLASESTALHFRLCFVPFVREGRTQTQQVKMKQQNGACPQVKEGKCRLSKEGRLQGRHETFTR